MKMIKWHSYNIFPLCKDKSFLPAPKGADVYHYYLDHLTHTTDVILSLKNKLNKHLETFNNANHEREQTAAAPQGPFLSAEQIFI